MYKSAALRTQAGVDNWCIKNVSNSASTCRVTNHYRNKTQTLLEANILSQLKYLGSRQSGFPYWQPIKGYIFDFASNEASFVLKFSNSRYYTNDNNILDVYVDSNQTFWMASSTQGVLRW